jgi:hypothetical protein
LAMFGRMSTMIILLNSGAVLQLMNWGVG